MSELLPQVSDAMPLLGSDADNTGLAFKEVLLLVLTDHTIQVVYLLYGWA